MIFTASGAGNYTDVWKHSVLLEVIEQLDKKEFKYFETHGSLDSYVITENPYPKMAEYANSGVFRIKKKKYILSKFNWEHTYFQIQTF